MTRFIPSDTMTDQEKRILVLAEKLDDVLCNEKCDAQDALSAFGTILAIQFSGEHLLPAIKAVAEVALCTSAEVKDHVRPLNLN